MSKRQKVGLRLSDRKREGIFPGGEEGGCTYMCGAGRGRICAGGGRPHLVVFVCERLHLCAVFLWGLYLCG